MTEKKKTSMAPVTTWEQIEAEKKAAKDEADVKIFEMTIQERIAFSLEKIVSLMEIQTECMMKQIDPSFELTRIETEEEYPIEEFEEEPDEIIEDIEVEYPDYSRESEIPIIPKPENLHDEKETEKYAKTLLKPHLKDDVVAKVQVTVGEKEVRIKLPWLEDDKHYKEGMDYRSMAGSLRGSGFEWVKAGKDSHWRLTI